MYAEKGEFDNEIDYFLSLNRRMDYNTEYKAVVEASGRLDKGIEPMTEALSGLASVLGTITIRSEVVNTLRAFGELYINHAVNTEEYIKLEEYESVYNKTFNVVSEGKLSLKLKMENNNNYADAA